MMPRIVTTLPIFAVLLAAYPATVDAQSGPPVRDARRTFQSYGRTWTDIRDQNIVKQQRDYSCGSAALATLLDYYWGDDIGEARILTVIANNLTRDELIDRIGGGLSLTDLRLAAVKLDYLASIGRVDIEKLTNVKVPVIVAIRLQELDHFVVVRGVVDDWIYLADPSRGNLRMPLGQFADLWIENALLVVAKQGQAISDVSQLGIGAAEVDRGWLNNQVIRTFPEKVFNIPRSATP